MLPSDRVHADVFSSAGHPELFVANSGESRAVPADRAPKQAGEVSPRRQRLVTLPQAPVSAAVMPSGARGAGAGRDGSAARSVNPSPGSSSAPCGSATRAASARCSLPQTLRRAMRNAAVLRRACVGCLGVSASPVVISSGRFAEACPFPAELCGADGGRRECDAAFPACGLDPQPSAAVRLGAWRSRSGRAAASALGAGKPSSKDQARLLQAQFLTFVSGPPFKLF